MDERNLDPLSRLRNTLREGTENTGLMIRKLQTFEQDLDTVEMDLRPLEESTRDYIVAKDNISKTLLEFGKTYEYFRIAADVKHIADRPYSKEKSREMFDALDRLSKAKDFFQKHNEMRSATSLLESVENTLGKIVTNCVIEVKKHVERAGSSVTIVQENNEDDKYVVANPIDDHILNHIQSITEVLDGLDVHDHLKVCASLREKQMLKDLSKQKDLRSDDWAAISKTDSPYSIRTNHPLQQYLAFVAELLQGELELWGVLFSMSASGMKIFTDNCIKVIEEIQELMLPHLEDNLSQSVSAVHKNNIFLIRLDMLDAFMMSYSQIYEICKPDFRHESEASLCITAARNALVDSCLGGIGQLLLSSRDAGPTLEPKTKTSQGVTKANKGHRKTAEFSSTNAGEKCDLLLITSDIVHCCTELLQFGKPFIGRFGQLARDIGLNVPMEANSHSQLIFSLLENIKLNLQDRADGIAAAVMVMASTSTQSTLNFTLSSQKKAGNTLFGMGRDIDAAAHTSKLYEAGDKEAELSVMTGCQHLFLANNFGRILDFLIEQKDALCRCIDSHLVEEYTESVENILTKSLSNFCTTIAETLSMSQKDSADFQAKHAASSSDKTTAGRLVKAKFSIFNSGLEALLNQQGAWRVSSSALREDVGKQLATTIVPIYSEFYNRFKDTGFSKRHADQYIKFIPEDVQTILVKFFG